MSPQEKSIAIMDSDGKAIAFRQSIYPPREVLDSFEAYHKGSAAEILRMSSEEQKYIHRIGYSSVKFRFMGSIFGFVLCLSMLLIGAFLIYADKPVSGCTTMIVAFLTLVGNFFGDRRKPKQ